MCGIFCTLHTSLLKQARTSVDNAIYNGLKRANAARGPDAQCTMIIGFPPPHSTPDISTEYILELYVSELQLRGNTPVMQPHTEGGDVLCWNGEVFEGLEIGPAENDGQNIFERFRVVTEPLSISEIIGSIEGPYAFVFYQGSSKKLYFARDPLGRRSLLIHKPTVANPTFQLASVAAGEDGMYEFEELPTSGVFVLDLDSFREPGNFVTEFHNGIAVIPRASADHKPFAVMTRVNQALPPDNIPIIQGLDAVSLPTPLLETMEQLITRLDRSVMLRVTDISQVQRDNDNPRIAVLFSGGIDSTMIAFLAHRHISLDEPIDLLNVAFENPRKIQLQLDGDTRAIPKKKKKPLKVAEHTLGGTVDGESSLYMVPDRVTGLQAVEELRKLCPGRMWNFVEIDVPYEESQAARPTVEAMMYPSRTVMDLSLALALYFASRGVGRVRDTKTSEYRLHASSARVLLSGLGSDEMLGGYGRHRTVFTTLGWRGVIDELQLELDRLPVRNLGRDDRVTSSHGKETRYPFLSLSVASFLAGLPVHLKLDPRLDVGIGDKMLLRLAARKVGLVEASVRKKRAMQFGSHSARMGGGEMERRGDSTVNCRAGTP